MKKKYWYITIIGTIIILSYYMGSEYHKFRLYTSQRVVTNMGEWWLHIDRFYKNHFKIPTANDFFNYCNNDTFILENFPELISKNLNKADFIISTDSISYFSVWLFSELKEDKDTLFFPEMNYMDFLLKKSVLLTSVPLSDPCGSETFIILENKQRVKNQQLENILTNIMKNISSEIKKESIGFPISCCFHVYFKHGKTQFEIISSEEDSILGDSLSNLIRSKFQKIEVDYYNHEFYFRIDY